MKNLLLPVLLLLMMPAAAQTVGEQDSDDASRSSLDEFRVDAPLITFPDPWTSPYRVDPDYPHQLVNDEGRHLFILNKTAWAFFGARDPEGFLERARRQGITVFRVALEGRPYFNHLGIDMWPWGGTRERPDWTTFNEEYWQEVERRITLAGNAGIGLDIVLYFTLHPDRSEIESQKAYWEYALERLGKYANVLTWEIANEYVENEVFQDSAGTFFHESDPFARPVCTSTGTTDDAIWPEKPWVDLAIVHTCTGSTPRYDLKDWYQSVARNVRAHGKPSFNNESGREVRHKNDDPVHRRKQGWIWNTSGGFWTWHSWEGCEGIEDPDYRGPGEEYLKPMSDFFRSIPFWKLNPNHTAFVVDDPLIIQSTLTDAERDLTVSYLCTGQTDDRVIGVIGRARIPDGDYEVSFVRPTDLAELETHQLISEGLGTVVEFDLPAVENDLLVVIRKKQAHTTTRIQDTE